MFYVRDIEKNYLLQSTCIARIHSSLSQNSGLLYHIQYIHQKSWQSFPALSFLYKLSMWLIVLFPSTAQQQAWSWPWVTGASWGWGSTVCGQQCCQWGGEWRLPAEAGSGIGGGGGEQWPPSEARGGDEGGEWQPPTEASSGQCRAGMCPTLTHTCPTSRLWSWSLTPHPLCMVMEQVSSSGSGNWAWWKRKKKA